MLSCRNYFSNGSQNFAEMSTVSPISGVPVLKKNTLYCKLYRYSQYTVITVEVWKIDTFNTKKFTIFCKKGVKNRRLQLGLGVNRERLKIYTVNFFYRNTRNALFISKIKNSFIKLNVSIHGLINCCGSETIWISNRIRAQQLNARRDVTPPTVKNPSPWSFATKDKKNPNSSS